MKKSLIFIGGLIVIAGVLLSFFVPLMTWYYLQMGTDIQVFNAMGGVNEQQIPDPIVILTFIPGNLALIGAVLAMIGGKKSSVFAGAILVMLGVALFILNIMGYTGIDTGIYNWVLWAETISSLGENVLWGSFENGSTEIVFRIGYGLITTAVGSLVIFAGGLTGEE